MVVLNRDYKLFGSISDLNNGPGQTGDRIITKYYIRAITMGEKKEPNEGQLPCMVCNESYNYLTTGHMETHASKKPQNISEYRYWVAEHSGLNRDHPAINSNQLLKSQLWQENEHLFEGWQDWD